MLSFELPLVLLLLPLALLPLRRRRARALPLSTLAPLDSAGPGWRIRVAKTQPWLAATTLLLLILAAGGPALERTTRTSVREGLDLMLALDISSSMSAEDLAPDRLSVARDAAVDFLEQRGNDRIGVILFAGVPYLLSPPTDAIGLVAGRLRGIEAERRGTGTALGDALAAATARLEGSPAAGKAVILLTDGASNRGRVRPRAAAQAAAALGVKVYTIGFGTPTTREGEDPLDEGSLRAIAGITGGRYFRAASAGALAEIYRTIDRLERTPLEVREGIDRTPLARFLLKLCASLVLLELLAMRLWLRRVP